MSIARQSLGCSGGRDIHLPMSLVIYTKLASGTVIELVSEWEDASNLKTNTGKVVETSVEVLNSISGQREWRGS